VLTLIGPRLAGVLRPQDTVARLGGDEFAILLPEVSCLATAMLVAEKVRYALAEPFTINDLDLDIEASIGVVVSGEHGDDANTLLQHADLAMYVAKKQNVGMFAYDAQADDNSSEKLALLSDLRRALDRSELTLHYQPKVSLSTSDVCGAEALIRWYHPRRGLISPDDFIPLAEKTGLIGPLTLHVLDAALAQAHTWAAAGHRIPVAVNLSARNLLDEHLPDTISRMLDEHAVAPELLELEVTETAITTDPKRAAASLARLKNLGIAISIDDFGAGYTSLAQLKTLPVTELKLDRSFVTGIDTDPRNAYIVKSVIDLGHNLGLTIVAEGVEDAAVMAMLTKFGCDVAQGYHLSRPLPTEAFDSWYLHRADTSNRQPPLTTIPL
jgi:predicted signal transduction protein with EAL and GGDEF domain